MEKKVKVMTFDDMIKKGLENMMNSLKRTKEEQDEVDRLVKELSKSPGFSAFQFSVKGK